MYKDQDCLFEVSCSINKFISNYLNVQEIELLAFQTKFVLRSSAFLRGYDFLFMSLICSKGDSYYTLEDMVDILKKYLNVCITKQTLAEKIDSSRAVDFLTACLNFAQRKKIEYILDEIPPVTLATFSKILLQDSTVINLHEKLSKFFKGSGGRASQSALKIDLIYDLKSKEFISLLITDMKIIDQSNSKSILEFLEPNTLVIRDLGYLQIEVLQKIEKDKSYFLSRMKTDYLVFLQRCNSDPVDLESFLKNEFLTKNVVDLTVFITKKKYPVRLVVYRCTEEVANQRRRVANAAAKKQGKTVSKKHKELSNYTLFITNVSKSIWKPEIVGTIYVLRWQIELIFKSWKSVCQVHILKGTRRDRIQTLILSKLLLLTIFTMIYSIAQKFCDVILKKETSMFKAFCWLTKEDNFFQILSSGTTTAEIERLIRRSLKDKRQRNTSWSNVKKQTAYVDIYKVKAC